MKVITLINEKGGVGKTTLARSIGLTLAQYGNKVCFIDADGQGDLTRSLGLKKQPNFNDFTRRPQRPLTHKDEEQSLIQRVPKDVSPYNVYCVAGNAETWGIAGSSRKTELARTMTQRLKQMNKFFDYVIFDTQPSPTMLHDAIGAVSRWMIFPTDAEKFSAEGGLRSSFANVVGNHEELLGAGLRRSEPLAIIPNKVRTGVILHELFVERLQQEYGDLVWDAIPLRTAIGEAQVALDSLTMKAPHLDTSHRIENLVQRIIKESANG